MFRKGIVTFFDEKSAKGLIELKNDHQQVVFKLEDFSNQTVLPQLGERIKCVVLEQDGEVLAKFIVRLDQKNYVSDVNNTRPITQLYQENLFENLRKVRKTHKKRRAVEEDQSTTNTKKPPQEATLTDSFLQSETQTVQEQLNNNQLGDDPQNQAFQSTTQWVEKIKVEADVQEDAADNKTAQQDALSPHIENDQFIQTSSAAEDQALLQNLEASRSDIYIASTVLEKDQKHLETELLNRPDSTITEQRIQAPISVDDQEKIFVNQTVKLNQPQQQGAVRQSIIDIGHTSVLTPPPEVIHGNHVMNQQVLEKNMSLNLVQRFIQDIKVQFLYSKRKQPKKKVASEQRMRLNPWIAVIGILLFVGVNCVMYAMDRYKQYKIESVMKLQQYQQQQKDVIKQQKRQAYSR
ncbi:hypothetical protein [Acinetobacter sp.]|jgi:cold shock CspA family protein|uniref:hypothetical protein n=1 Tax=Acinetobacter sp. TaxID=472 RepID=UPI002816E3FF|nr:hypothetical protein [Acinetobacter sp.]MDR0235655.1 hypothetical protein [Acinetobacter sp.]